MGFAKLTECIKLKKIWHELRAWLPKSLNGFIYFRCRHASTGLLYFCSLIICLFWQMKHNTQTEIKMCTEPPNFGVDKPVSPMLVVLLVTMKMTTENLYCRCILFHSSTWYNSINQLIFPTCISVWNLRRTRRISRELWVENLRSNTFNEFCAS